MNDTAPAGIVRHVANLFGDIGGFVAVLVAYVLALSGRSPGPIPQTTAIITVFVTTIVVWVWRAKRITRRKPEATQAAPDQAAEGDGRVAGVSRVLDPLRSPGNPPYEMSLQRRRTELAGLIMLTAAALGWSSSRASAAVQEISGPRPSTPAAFTCVPANTTPTPRVVIADFEDAAPQYGSTLENRLFDALTEDSEDERTICRFRQVVGTRQEARILGQQTRAVLVIWGRSDVVFEVHLELANSRANGWDVPGRELPPLPAEELANYDFAVREPSRLSFLTDLVLSQVLYLDHKGDRARQLLDNALRRAGAPELAQDNAPDVGEAYFLLGYLYDPYVSGSGGDADRALAAYSRAIELDPGLEVATLNRGKIYESLDEPDLAVADYTTIIAAGGRLAGAAAVNRAYLQPDRAAAERDFALGVQLDPLTGYWGRAVARQDLWNDLPGALADLETAVKLDPPEYYYYESLGQLQLLTGQAAAARETYRRLIPRLDQETMEAVIGALQALAEQKPALAADVAAIVSDLRAAVVR